MTIERTGPVSHQRFTRVAFAMLLCSIAFSAASQAEEPWLVASTERIVAVADIHGAHTAFVAILEQAGVIDNAGQWAGDATHLVVVGDVLDRGPESRKSLDLLMALQPAARARGGDVHLVLGNHEVMNLVGDLRYVSPAEFAAFAAEETAAMRGSGFMDYRSRVDPSADPDTARVEFDRRFPPGYFAHREAFSSTGTYGSWLLDQPLLVVANDSLFVHGGLSRAFAGLDGEAINTALKQELRDYIATMEELIDAGILSYIDDFYEHGTVIGAFSQAVDDGAASWPEETSAAAERLQALSTAKLFDLSSPTWYRGMADCSPLVEEDHWRRVHDQFDVDRVVIGHTPTPDSRILSRMNGGILRIDTGMLASYYGGQAAALLIDENDPLTIHAGESAYTAAQPQPRRVGRRPNSLTDEALERLLRDGQISAPETAANGLQVTVSVSDGGVAVDADFLPAEGDARPQIAAYRLDRLIGLDMVPVTVERTVDGVAGSLQFRPAGLMTESERASQGIGGSAWCPLRDQFPSMYVFDSLIYNEGRTVEQIAYDAESFALILLGNENAFSTQRGRPQHLREAMLEIAPAWQTALRGLDEDRLTEALGEVLSRRQIRALARRAAELLDDAA